MATKSKTTTKPRTAKKTVKGSSSLKTNKFNFKLLALFILPVAIIGGFFVFKSNAAREQWIPGGSQAAYGSISKSGGTYGTKGNGEKYWNASTTSASSITLNLTRIFANSEYCVEYDGDAAFPVFTYSHPSDNAGGTSIDWQGNRTYTCSVTIGGLIPSTHTLSVKVSNKPLGGGKYSGVTVWRFDRNY